MGIRELLRRATPALLETYKRELPRIRNPKQFQNILRRKKAMEAILIRKRGGSNGN